MLIKAREIKPGMILNTRPNNNSPDFCIVVACSGYHDIEYTHFNYSDAYGGQMIGTLGGDDAVFVITNDNFRDKILKSVKNDIFKYYHDAKKDVDIIRLIEEILN